MQTHSFPEGSNFMIRPVDHVNEYDFTRVHRHNYFEIFLFEQAKSGYQIIDFQRFDLIEKSVYIVCPNQIHQLRRQESEQGSIMQFTREFLQAAISSFHPEWTYALNSTSVLKLNESQFQETKELFEQLQRLSEQRNQFNSYQLNHFFAYTLFHLLGMIEASNETTSCDALSLRFLSLAEKHFSEQRQVQYYARALNVSPTTLGRHVKKNYGKTPLELLHGLLLLEIKRLLILGQLSHKEISYALHFDSPSSYNKFILLHTGKSPSQLKEQLMEIHKS